MAVVVGAEEREGQEGGWEVEEHEEVEEADRGREEGEGAEHVAADADVEVEGCFQSRTVEAMQLLPQESLIETGDTIIDDPTALFILHIFICSSPSA